MKYILNSAVITAPGAYEYHHISAEEARAFLDDGDFISTIGYPETAEALSTLINLPIHVNRKIIKMQPGDQALVFRLTCRVGADRLAIASKGTFTPEFVLANCEIGLLTMLRGDYNKSFYEKGYEAGLLAFKKVAKCTRCGGERGFSVYCPSCEEPPNV